ncbi:MAG: Lactate utilization protein C [Candidatus Ordinivivax streblomastigis]|uniref:Lactate utilization protein C n=1 Tax=Candidatus Ordinivivax streblomastigis TaxID=2540710 RepID=A0A5M8NUZ0_9BACT|nr:MAG: Lactate utilization protein C [Candidatus Ordinivivax streblomastigis]
MSKADILQAIRKNRPVFLSLPEKSADQPPLPDTGEQLQLFQQSLKIAGAEVVELKATEIAGYMTATWQGVLDFDRLDVRAEYPASCALEKLDKVEHAAFTGKIGVAENGAIWLDDSDMPHRLLPFITQHLILKFDTSRIVATMQEAYRQLRMNGFGVFISGPSKTADIEQSLVYGAHGAKELTVILYCD